MSVEGSGGTRRALALHMTNLKLHRHHTTAPAPSRATDATPAHAEAAAEPTTTAPRAETEAALTAGADWSRSTASDGSATSAAAVAAHLPKPVRSTPAFAGVAEVPSTQPVPLTQPQLEGLVKVKVRCPFMGPAVASGELPVRNSAEKPLAKIDDIASLGNTGGGDLGRVLAFFAGGNHTKMPGASGKLDTQVPTGTMSLDLAGSQGAHPGHSGILLGDPTKTNAGRLSAEDFARLEKYATPDGHLTQEAVGKFIAENLVRDPASKVAGLDVAHLLAKDLGAVLGQTGPTLLEKVSNWTHGTNTSAEHTKLLEKLTKLLGEDNLVGSAGEFGLLFAFLAHAPSTTHIDGQPAVALADVRRMFVDGKLPEGWASWPKTSTDWVKASVHLSAATVQAYAHLKHT